MLWTIPRCYDSHTHLLATGVMQKGLSLFALKDAHEVSKLKIEPHHFRGEWLIGFGWDQNKWNDSRLPSKEILDQIFPDFPVAFSRADGHAVWLNSKALQKAGFYNQTESEKPTPSGGVVIRDEKGFPTGIMTELAKIEIDLLIPDYTREQKKIFLKEANGYFNSRGFSHLRDMSGFIDQWDILRELDLSGELNLYVEENFTCENLNDFERALKEAQQARATETQHLKARGIKFYFDGSLGSQGAFLSQFYPGTNHQGLTLWNLDHVAEVIERTWREGFEVCVHTIGDEAAHLILKTALKVVSERKIKGLLNVEHAEILRPETIELMKELTVVCHLQPCHWLTDRIWLKEKLGSLYAYAFPWKALQENGIAMQWGSDSPIEAASVENNWRALKESSREGIPELSGDLLAYHQHRDPTWGSQCESHFENGKLKSFCFDGRWIQ
ncbi:MAG: amidohydrolase [Pseudobdellovibrionaceae bacterium]